MTTRKSPNYKSYLEKIYAKGEMKNYKSSTCNYRKLVI